MTVLKPRSRMISVRLSEDEYSALRKLCSATGARSVSDFTRDAMRSVLNDSALESPPSNYVDEFRMQIRSLDQKIEELAARIASPRTEQEG